MFKIERHTEVLEKTRVNMLKIVNGLSLEQLNKIPEGFNNSIVWNFIHSLSSQQGLVYGMSGVPLKIDSRKFVGFKKGDKPERPVTQEELDFFKEFAMSSIKALEEDYKSGVFKEYKEYATSYGYTITNAQEAIIFSTIHEGLHFGYMLALKHLV